MASQPQTSVIWPLVRIPGLVVAYAAVPLSFGYGPILPIPDITTPLYITAAVGFLAVLRGAVVTPLLMVAGYVCLGWYAVLLAIETFHGELFAFPLLYQANLLANGFVLVAFPFFVIGLRELRIDMRIFEWTIMPSIVIVAGVAIYQYAVLEIERPAGFSTNPIIFGLICMVWCLLLLARALSMPAVMWSRLIAAFVGLIPIALSGSKLIWLCTFLGYGGLFLAWALRNGRWRTLLATVALLIPAGWLLYRAQFIQTRLLEMDMDFGGFIARGDSSGSSFGLRYTAAIGGLRAFLDRPLLGYGMVDAKLAATLHRAPADAPFGNLFHLHNEYVTYMVAFGVLGLVFVLTLLAAFFFASSRSDQAATRHFGYAVSGTLVVYTGAEVISYHSQVHGLVYFVLGLLFVSADLSLLGRPATAAAVPVAAAA